MEPEQNLGASLQEFVGIIDGRAVVPEDKLSVPEALKVRFSSYIVLAQYLHVVYRSLSKHLELSHRFFCS